VVSVPVAVLLLGETLGLRTAAGIGCAVVAVLALSFESPPGRAAGSNRTAAIR
jgi:hypothetical protein